MHEDLCIENLVVKLEKNHWGSSFKFPGQFWGSQSLKIKGTWVESRTRYCFQRNDETDWRVVAPEM
jgi:hypothetical protein